MPGKPLRPAIPTEPPPQRRRTIRDRRLRLGRRLSLYIEPRDAWIGVYIAPKAVYVSLLPFCVARWARR